MVESLISPLLGLLKEDEDDGITKVTVEPKFVPAPKAERVVTTAPEFTAPGVGEDNPELVDIESSQIAQQAEIGRQTMSAAELVMEGLKTTAVANVIRRVGDEGWLEPLGFGELDGTTYDKREFAKTVDPRISRSDLDTILSYDTLEGATRTMHRILAEYDRGAKMAVQSPGSTLAVIGASLVDIDAPLMLLSGSALKAARVAQQSLRMSRAMGLAPATATRVSSIAQGLNAGAQASGLVGVTEVLTRDTAHWTDLAAMMLGGTALGGALGGTFNLGLRDTHRAATAEFYQRVREDNVNLREDFDPEKAFDSADGFDPPETPAADATVIGGEAPPSVGAAGAPGGGRPRRVLEDPAGPIGKSEAEWIDFADDWRHRSDFMDVKKKDEGTWYANVSLSSIGGFSANNFFALYKSNSSVANWIAANVFESPNGMGRGRSTSSVLMERYHRVMQTHIGVVELDQAMARWAIDNVDPVTGKNYTFAQSGRMTSGRGRRIFSREVMLEMSDMQLGRTSNRHASVKEAAARYDSGSKTGLGILRGRNGERSVDGFGPDGVKDKDGYFPYRHNGFAANDFIKQGVTVAELEAGLAAAYRNAGIENAADADAIAKATLARSRAGDHDLDSSLDTLLSADGREWLAIALRDNGMGQLKIDLLLKRLIQASEVKSREGFAKFRNELDMDTAIPNKAGVDIKVVDLMEQDLHRSFQRYTRQASGAAAMARVGITSRGMRKTVIKAMQAEMRSLGEDPMSTELMEAMFSHFNAGPVWGFSGGVTNKGIGVEAATAKRLAGVGLLERMGMTQLGETGAIIAAVGVENFFRRGVMIAWDKELRAHGRELLDEMGYLNGDVGLDHRFMAEWQDLDDVSKADRAQWWGAAGVDYLSRTTQNMVWLQQYTNGFNHIRGWQQRTAVRGIIDRVFRDLQAGKMDPMSARMRSDLGLGPEELERLRDLIENGTIEFHTRGYVRQLNLDKWDWDLADMFGSATTRSMNQQVQKSMAGEQDAWMHTGWGSIMTHLLTFPMASFQKQFIRNAKHMDTQAIAAMTFGLTTAMLMIMVRDAHDGRERDIHDQMERAFSYNNATSWAPMVWNPAMTILGQDDLRIAGYGAHESVVPPVFTQADALRRVPGALISAASGGDFDFYDQQAIKAIPFANTYVFSRMLEAAMK